MTSGPDPTPNLREYWEAVYSCVGCGDCGYAIRPAIEKFLSCPVKEAVDSGFEVFFARGKMKVAKALLEGKLPLSRDLSELVYQCTTCGACHDTCHQSHNPNIQHFVTRWIDHVGVWEALRRDLVAAGHLLDEHARMLESLRDPSRLNPYGEPSSTKRDAIASLEGFAEPGGASTVLFAGCTMALRSRGTLENLGKIFERAGEKVALVPEEHCCGSVALRIGDEEAARECMEANLELFREYGVTRVVTACAGCFRTLKDDYEKLGAEGMPEVVHVSEILPGLAERAGLQFSRTDPLVVTYHDPCHLGRHMGVYSQPRETLALLPGVDLVEMKRHGHNAWCCGAGGGVKGQFPDLAVKIATDRVREARETGATTIVTACPFCERNLSDGLGDSGLEVLDIVDLFSSRL
ncbi:MAG: (Fe-S)-binding protein [Promethearchaeota archaeon]